MNKRFDNAKMQNKIEQTFKNNEIILEETAF